MPKTAAKPPHHRDVVVAFVALDLYLAAGSRDAAETREAFAALQRNYDGPSRDVLDQFHAIASAEDAGLWLAKMRGVLESEIDSAVWADVARREQLTRQTQEPREPRKGKT
jgi:hypothetical protein